jgi:hypothetical protein
MFTRIFFDTDPDPYLRQPRHLTSAQIGNHKSKKKKEKEKSLLPEKINLVYIIPEYGIT